MTDNMVILVIQTVIVVVSAYFAYRATLGKLKLDDSQEEINYQSLYTSAQRDMKLIQLQNQEIKAENKKIMELLDASHLEITLVVEMGKEPVVKRHQWTKKITGELKGTT